MTIKLIATSLDNKNWKRDQLLLQTVRSASNICLPSSCWKGIALEKQQIFGRISPSKTAGRVSSPPSRRPLLLIRVFAREFPGWRVERERQAFHLRLLRVGTRRSWVGAGCISDEKTWARQTGRERGLTAPSRAASYHGPMPTLSTCPSWNKDGRGLQQHPRQGYPRGIALGGVRACVYESYKRGEGFRSMHAPRQT